jgi:hypothetical protein
MEAAMSTVCLRFRLEEHPKIHALMETCAAIQRQPSTTPWKTARLPPTRSSRPSPLREKYLHLHSDLIYGAIRSGTRVVRGFRNRQRKGKTRADRPEIRRPSIYLVQRTVKIKWDRGILTVTIPVSLRDPDPIVLTDLPSMRQSR